VSEEKDVQVEATGETVGEAKWAALRELEQLVSGLDRDAVEFEVLSEGERGLLGVGYAPARVVAHATGASGSDGESSDAVDDAREFVRRITTAIGADVTVTAVEREGTVVATCSGEDLGLVIGKRGQTIDAIQYLANAVVRAQGGEHDVVVDAAGYRARRTALLEKLAATSAERATRLHDRVVLEPMTAVERKIVHEALKDDPAVLTASEGTEPNRYVVVLPADG